MNANKNSSRGRQSRKKNPQKTSPKKFENKKKFSRVSEERSKTKQVEPPAASEGIRLNKYISNSGICSRREADVFIKAGSATVNGKLITEMGYKVSPTDEVRFDGILINPEQKRYVLLNKPQNFITTMEDERGRRTVMELVANASKERIYRMCNSTFLLDCSAATLIA